MKKGGFVYIMTNKNKNVLYIGVTSNLPQRIHQHRFHLLPDSFTDRYNVENLIYYEFYESIVVAIAREKQLKGWNRKKKDFLIDLKNPSRRDLYPEVSEDIYSLLD